MTSRAKNVLGKPLQCCCSDPCTGFYRDGHCHSGPDDVGAHVICVQVTEAFLDFSREQGNDLSTPRPEFDFPGLRPGDRWCVCAARWRDAWQAGVAPPVCLSATEARALRHVSLEVLATYAVDEALEETLPEGALLD
ncbi:MAG: DUF2237 family protein [Polyangiales bacterium]